jgi:hypothetical protein
MFDDDCGKIPIIMTAKIEKNISIFRPCENELEIFAEKRDMMFKFFILLH